MSLEQIRQGLQAHSEGSHLRGIRRPSGLAYNPVVSIVRAASQRAQQVHNAHVETIPTQAVSADEMGFLVQNNRSTAVLMN